MANYQLPKALSRSELKKDVAGWEQRQFKEPKHTLSQAVDDKRFIQAWDTAKLTSAEVALIHEKFTKNQSVSLILVQLQKR
jgi:hypothetical protein